MKFIYPQTDSTEPVTFAKPDFDEKGIPASPIFEDVYFSDAGGAQEKEHVFVHGNGLPERLIHSKEDDFAIGETGFGSGLSLLVLMHNLKNAGFPQKGANLIYLTTELYPMKRADMATAHAFFPDLKAESEELLNVYDENNLHQGLNVLTPWPRTQILLLVGDVTQTLPRLVIENGGIRAWFLDGFSPQKDVAMWSPECAQELMRLSLPQATISTYTVAGFVRRNLIAAGFTLKREKGFGRKKEMLTGIAGME